MKSLTGVRNAKPGTCVICGCTDDLACADGCCWVNEENTLCSNEICVAVADREAVLLRAVDLVLSAAWNDNPRELSFHVPRPALRSLARLRKRFPAIDLGTLEHQRRMREQGGAV